ncbi:hypothetical protein AVEN_220931-1 [Araneus ventricosus]|uniref:Uncharacterized protein n=1 Tax=Araneus ventricosus TaxID=182803 RepID=A0A4Y2PWH8_ARAVE|nr:hypothetical protein AVEN_266843-1 [Araneus ventricosus]GBN54607.1 hypothetical protein AVEN_104915-1 [Araneus ventricosus]GBN54615.1 hypothetical protein AVEN_156636-1 [Araneus ventricosus]GBN54636.1 hypothetical protein AVEN_220931-1 [Araneus ventricosus]
MYACHFQCLILSLGNAIYKGTCYLDRDNKSFGIIGSSEIKTLCLLPISVITEAFMTFGPRRVNCNRVPLRSLALSRLRISDTGTPTINLGLSEGAPDNSKMLKSSTGYVAPC